MLGGGLYVGAKIYDQGRENGVLAQGLECRENIARIGGMSLELSRTIKDLELRFINGAQ